MKIILTLLLALIPISGFSQNKIPVIHASSNQARIYKQHNAVTDWHINPKLKPDIFLTGKMTRPGTIKFRRDIDSLSFYVGPGLDILGGLTRLFRALWSIELCKQLRKSN